MIFMAIAESSETFLLFTNPKTFTAKNLRIQKKPLIRFDGADMYLTATALILTY